MKKKGVANIGTSMFLKSPEDIFSARRAAVARSVTTPGNHAEFCQCFSKLSGVGAKHRPVTFSSPLSLKAKT